MVILLAALLLGASVSAEQVGGGNAVIRGRVMAADTGRPMRGARVEVDQRVTAVVDEGGFYEMAGLAAGHHTLIVRPPPYRAMYLQARRLASGEPALVEVGEGQIVDGVDFALPRAGAIGGRVVDELGQPVTSVGVTAIRAGIRRRLPVGGARTDDEGRFRLWGLAPGRYYLHAGAAPAAQSFETGPSPETFLRTFYPGTTDAHDAVPITLSESEDRQHVDIQLVRGRTFAVSGVVTDPTGRPVPGARVVLEAPAGADVVIVIGDGAATLAGVVEDAAGRRVPGRLVYLYPAAADPGEWHLVDSFFTETDNEGRFELGITSSRPIPPGDYFVIAFAEPPGFLASAADEPLPTTPEEDAAVARALGTRVTLGARERKEIRLRPVARPY